MTTEKNDGLKPQYGWTVKLFLPVTPFFARLCVRLGVTANQVSWSSLFVFLIGLFFYVQYNDSLFFRCIAVVFFVLGTFLDVLDGAVARHSGTSSRYGALLDTVIDLVRYDLFFLAVYYLFNFNPLDTLVLSLYLLLLNYSFLSFIRQLYKGNNESTNRCLYDNFLPLRYKNFCLKHKILYNPLNLEDQLLFLFFVVGVIFQVEIIVLYIATAARLFDAFLILKQKLNW